MKTLFCILGLTLLLIGANSTNDHQFGVAETRDVTENGVCRRMMQVPRSIVYDGGEVMHYISVVADTPITQLNITMRPHVNLDVIVRHLNKARRFGLSKGSPLKLEIGANWLKYRVAVVAETNQSIYATLQFIKSDERLPLTVLDLQVSYYGDGMNCTETSITEIRPNLEHLEGMGTGLKRRKRAVETMEWFKVQEYEHQAYLWFTPITSAYGVNSLALAGGRDFFEGHEFVELPGLQNSNNVVWIPGMLSAGPIRQTDSWDSEYGQGRSLLRYSNRDAAWLVWNYNTNKPAWNGNWDRDYWQKHTPAVPATMRAVVFNAPLLG